MNVQYRIVCIVNFRRLLYYNLNIIKFNSIKLYSISPCFLLSAHKSMYFVVVLRNHRHTGTYTNSFNCNAELKAECLCQQECCQWKRQYNKELGHQVWQSNGTNFARCVWVTMSTLLWTGKYISHFWNKFFVQQRKDQFSPNGRHWMQLMHLIFLPLSSSSSLLVMLKVG